MDIPHELNKTDREPSFKSNTVFQCENCEVFVEAKTKAKAMKIITPRYICSKETFEDEAEETETYIVQFTLKRLGVKVKIDKKGIEVEKK